MDALIAEARKQYHKALLENGVLAINAQGVENNTLVEYENWMDNYLAE